MTDPDKRGESRSAQLSNLVLGFLILFLIVHRAVLALVRDFDPDELQHVHGGFSMASGLLPYRDYFEHHTPWFSGLASMLVSALGPEWNTLMVARVLIWSLSTVTTLAVGCMVYQATRRRLGVHRAGWSAGAAMLALLTIVTATDKAIEIRPDVPATLLLVLSLLALLEALRGERRTTLWAGVGGLALGAGLMFTPKLAFAALGVGAGVIAASCASPQVARSYLRALVVYVGASALPIAATAAWLAAGGQLEDCIRGVVIGPLRWAREVDPWTHLAILVQQNPLHLIAGFFGLATMLLTAFRSRQREESEPSNWIVPSVALAIGLGWFVIPVPWPQFLLPLWPFLAFGVALAVEAVRGWGAAAVAGALAALGVAMFRASFDLPDGWAIPLWMPGLSIVGAATLASLAWAAKGASRTLRLGMALAAALVLGLGALRLQPHSLTYGSLWLALAALIVLAEPKRRAAVAILVAVVAVPLIPIGRLIERRPLGLFRAEFDLIMRATEPTDTVLTGWRGCAVFRPHAYRYFSLHPGMLQMLTEEERGDLVMEALARSNPKAVIRDAGTRGLGVEVQAYLDARYRPTGVGDIWLREE